MLAKTAATRGLPLPDELETRVVRHADLPNLLRQMFADEWTAQELWAAEEMMAVIGLWPGDLDLLEESIRVQGDQVAGLYSPPRRALYIVEGVPAPDFVAAVSTASGRDLYTEFVLSHEIVHSLQHQAFPQLFEVTSQWKEQDDIVLALHAAIEGDALRYGFEVISPEGNLPSSDIFLQAQGVEEVESLAQAPLVLRRALVFPYARGYPLSLAEGKHLLASPPVSTEQAIHADKRRESFWSIDLGAVATALPPECDAVGENTLGEFLLSTLFGDLGAGTDATAWEGWDGDRYLVATCSERREFVWITAWDSEADAVEFQSAYETIAAAVAERADLEAPPLSQRHGNEVHVFTHGLASLAARIDAEVRRTRVANLTDLLAADRNPQPQPQP